MVNNALMVIDPVQAIIDSKARKDIVVAMREKEILRAGVDYGVVPGSEKPTLLKPGAERLCSAFHFDPRFDTLTAVERWDGDEPLFFYRVVCRLIHIESGLEVATGIGSCNSRESKYRWRWVDEAKLPPSMDKALLETRNATLSEFKFAVEKAETTGKYGKPAAYWQSWRDAIANGTARKVMRPTAKGQQEAYELGGLQYRIPNDDIFSLVNTIDKMAQKRALIAATLIGANASEFFTQDIEDMPGFGLDVIDMPVEVIQEGVEQSAGSPPPIKIETPATPPPAPKGWATESEVSALVNNGMTTLGLLWGDITRYTGIQKRDDYDAWNKIFLTRKAAADCIKAGFDADMLALKPATPKTEETAATPAQ